MRCDSGSYQRAKHGYRVKTCGFSAQSKPNTVQESIDAITDLTRKTRLEEAYNFLITHPNFHCRHFIRMQDCGEFPAKLQFYQLFRLPFIETALWPELYFTDFLCESTDNPNNPSKKSKSNCFYGNAFPQTSTIPRSSPSFIFNKTVGSTNPSVAQSTLLSNSVSHHQLLYLPNPTVTPCGVGNTPCF